MPFQLFVSIFHCLCAKLMKVVQYRGLASSLPEMSLEYCQLLLTLIIISYMRVPIYDFTLTSKIFSGLETFIRAKYEQKKYIASEWVPPKPKAVVSDWLLSCLPWFRSFLSHSIYLLSFITNDWILHELSINVTWLLCQ